MAAYVIMIRDRMRDPNRFADYAELAPKVTNAPLPDVLAFYGPHESLEGADSDGVVILSFASIADARRWYDSGDYSAARRIRHEAADYRVMIVEGLTRDN